MSAISAGADEDADLAAAIAASVAESFTKKKTASAPLSSRRDADARSASGGTLGACADDQGDVKNAFEHFLLEPEPAMNDVDAIDVAVRGCGARARRRFRKADTVRSLEAWVGRALGLDMRRHQLATSFPRKALTDPDATLEQAGVRDKDALAVEPKRG